MTEGVGTRFWQVEGEEVIVSGGSSTARDSLSTPRRGSWCWSYRRFIGGGLDPVVENLSLSGYLSARGPSGCRCRYIKLTSLSIIAFK